MKMKRLPLSKAVVGLVSWISISNHTITSNTPQRRLVHPFRQLPLGHVFIEKAPSQTHVRTLKVSDDELNMSLKRHLSQGA